MWQHSLYGLTLLVTLGCLWLIDREYGLVFYKQAKAAAVTIAIGVLFFAAWDLAGIHADIFFTGSERFLSGFYLAPNFPVEELLFLTILCYLPLLLTEYVKGTKNG